MSKLTVSIPDDLHQKIREELEKQGITTSQFIEQSIRAPAPTMRNWCARWRAFAIMLTSWPTALTAPAWPGSRVWTR